MGSQPGRSHAEGDGHPRGLLRPCLLLLLAERDDHGYELLDRLQRLGLDGNDHGGTYRALRSLERRGLVKSSWTTPPAGPARRDYTLTAAGYEQLEAWTVDLEQEHELLHAYLARFAALRAGEADAAAANGNGLLRRPIARRA